VRVVADQDAPLTGLDAVEDDLGGLRGARRRLLGEAAFALGDDAADIVV